MTEPISLMEKIAHYNNIINGFVWGTPMLCLLVGTGVYLTVLLGVPQLRYFFLSLKEVFGSRKAGRTTEDKSISSFAALATAMAATIKTDNVASNYQIGRASCRERV